MRGGAGDDLAEGWAGCLVLAAFLLIAALLLAKLGDAGAASGWES